jgi:hypothetical protein
MNCLHRNLHFPYLVITTLGGLLTPIKGYANEQKQGDNVTEAIQEIGTRSLGDGYNKPLPPLNTVGEKINELIRIKKGQSYTANLVFVERRDWPKERKDRLNRIYEGFASINDEIQPYPIKLRFQLDSVDAPSNVHIDIIHEKRNVGDYSTYYPPSYKKLPNGQPSTIWRAQGLWGAPNIGPGVYRVRIENLTPCSGVDFDTLFQFYHPYVKP